MRRSDGRTVHQPENRSESTVKQLAGLLFANYSPNGASC